LNHVLFPAWMVVTSVYFPALFEVNARPVCSSVMLCYAGMLYMRATSFVTHGVDRVVALHGWCLSSSCFPP
jgi:hypothetical protein